MKTTLLSRMLSNSERSTNQLQQQQTWFICFTTFSILTSKCLIAFLVVKLFTLGGNVKYASSLKQKSSSKTTGLTGMVLLRRSVGIRFVRRWRRQPLQGGINGIRISEKVLVAILELKIWRAHWMAAIKKNVYGHKDVHGHNEGKINCLLEQGI